MKRFSKENLEEIVWESVNWIILTQGGDQEWVLPKAVVNRSDL